jgi:hypothetical protein
MGRFQVKDLNLVLNAMAIDPSCKVIDLNKIIIIDNLSESF